jgi:sulfur carrier protein
MTLRKKVYEVKAGMTIRHAILKLDIIPESVLPVKNGELMTDDEILEDGDEIKLVAVISGG